MGLAVQNNVNCSSSLVACINPDVVYESCVLTALEKQDKDRGSVGPAVSRDGFFNNIIFFINMHQPNNNRLAHSYVSL